MYKKTIVNLIIVLSIICGWNSFTFAYSSQNRSTGVRFGKKASTYHNQTRFQYSNRGYNVRKSQKQFKCKRLGAALCLNEKKYSKYPSRYKNRLKEQKIHPYLKRILKVEPKQNF